MQHLAGAARRFEIFAAEIPQPEVQAFPGRGPLDDVCVALELVADGRLDEIGPVRVERYVAPYVGPAERVAKVYAASLIGANAVSLIFPASVNRKSVRTCFPSYPR